jgi:hypothetical protein
MVGRDGGHTGCCPVFGVESGIPLIGLGVLMMVFGIVPLLLHAGTPFPVPITALFIGFGIFLIWAGLSK